MPDTKPMTPSAAERIQSHADKTNTNHDFKARAQAAAAKNTGTGTAKTGGTKK